MVGGTGHGDLPVRKAGRGETLRLPVAQVRYNTVSKAAAPGSAGINTTTSRKGAVRKTKAATLAFWPPDKEIPRAPMGT